MPPVEYRSPQQMKLASEEERRECWRVSRHPAWSSSVGKSGCQWSCPPGPGICQLPRTSPPGNVLPTSASVLFCPCYNRWSYCYSSRCPYYTKEKISRWSRANIVPHPLRGRDGSRGSAERVHRLVYRSEHQRQNGFGAQERFDGRTGGCVGSSETGVLRLGSYPYHEGCLLGGNGSSYGIGCEDHKFGARVLYVLYA